MRDKVLYAIIFAMNAHEGQKRKYTGEAYYYHPVDVMRIILNYAKSHTKDMLCAALLHDTLEDTDTKYEDIEGKFGKDVADMVLELTDISRKEDGIRSIRKEIDREHIAKARPESKTIKLADLISNSMSIVEHDKEFAKVYIKEKELLLEVLTEGDATLYKIAEYIVCKAKEELEIE
jgi:(p)ppGpp synthase/HD superfamily hydrolase